MDAQAANHDTEWRGPPETGWTRQADGRWRSPEDRLYEAAEVVLPDTGRLAHVQCDPDEAERRNGYALVRGVIASGTAGYARRPDGAAAARGMARRPEDATPDEAWGAECFLSEASHTQMLAGIDEGFYSLRNLVEWLAWTGEHLGRHDLVAELNRRGKEPGMATDPPARLRSVAEQRAPAHNSVAVCAAPSKGGRTMNVQQYEALPERITREQLPEGHWARKLSTPGELIPKGVLAMSGKSGLITDEVRAWANEAIAEIEAEASRARMP